MKKESSNIKLYYLGSGDPNDGYLEDKSWHIVGTKDSNMVAMFDTWKHAEEYLDFINTFKLKQELLA